MRIPQQKVFGLCLITFGLSIWINAFVTVTGIDWLDSLLQALFDGSGTAFLLYVFAYVLATVSVFYGLWLVFVRIDNVPVIRAVWGLVFATGLILLASFTIGPLFF